MFLSQILITKPVTGFFKKSVGTKAPVGAFLFMQLTIVLQEFNWEIVSRPSAKQENYGCAFS